MQCICRKGLATLTNYFLFCSRNNETLTETVKAQITQNVAKIHTLTHTTRRCKVRHTTQKSHLPRSTARGICDRCERPSKRGFEGPTRRPGKSAPVPKKQTVSFSCSEWARRERSVGILEQIDPTTHTNAYELRSASTATKADTARRRASKRQAFVATTYADRRARVGFSREKGSLKGHPPHCHSS